MRVADGTVYLYGTTKRSNIGSADVWVARAPFAEVTNPSAWEYSTGLPALLDWNSDFTLAQPMTFTGTLEQDQDDIKAPLAQLSVTPYGDEVPRGGEQRRARHVHSCVDRRQSRGSVDNTSVSSPPRSSGRARSRTTPGWRS